MISDANHFNVSIWYNSTYKGDTGKGPTILVRVPRSINQRVKVEQLLLEPSTSHAIVCDDIKKIYPGRDGNPEKLAVRGLSLALRPGECIDMLGPNGAGKTSFISMMIGLTKPTSGAAFVQGLDIRTDMDRIHTSMGVCPQDDLLWETLTGREHLLFYGRLKNLKGSALTQASYGGSYVFTVTTSADHEKEVENMVRRLSPNANKIYQISGTQKFELPNIEVRIAEVFQAVENAKSMFIVFAWGLADTPMEDVFIKVACSTYAFNALS